jgi:hypothetical protein
MPALPNRTARREVHRVDGDTVTPLKLRACHAEISVTIVPFPIVQTEVVAIRRLCVRQGAGPRSVAEVRQNDVILGQWEQAGTGKEETGREDAAPAGMYPVQWFSAESTALIKKRQHPLLLRSRHTAVDGDRRTRRRQGTALTCWPGACNRHRLFGTRSRIHRTYEDISCLSYGRHC